MVLKSHPTRIRLCNRCAAILDVVPHSRFCGANLNVVSRSRCCAAIPGVVPHSRYCAAILDVPQRNYNLNIIFVKKTSLFFANFNVNLDVDC